MFKKGNPSGLPFVALVVDTSAERCYDKVRGFSIAVEGIKVVVVCDVVEVDAGSGVQLGADAILECLESRLDQVNRNRRCFMEQFHKSLLHLITEVFPQLSIEFAHCC